VVSRDFSGSENDWASPSRDLEMSKKKGFFSCSPKKNRTYLTSASGSVGDDTTESGVDDLTTLIVLEDLFIEALVEYFERNPDRVPSNSWTVLSKVQDNSGSTKRSSKSVDFSMDEDVVPPYKKFDKK